MVTWAIYDRGPNGTWRWLVTFDMFQTRAQAETALQTLLRMPQHCHLRDRAVVLPTLESSTGYELIEFLGKKLTMTAWAARLHISQSTLRTRLMAGMAFEEAVTTPPRYAKAIRPETAKTLKQLRRDYRRKQERDRVKASDPGAYQALLEKARAVTAGVRERVRKDPVKYADSVRKRREACRKYHEAVQADPDKRAARRAKRREYDANYLARKKAARETERAA